MTSLVKALGGILFSTALLFSWEAFSQEKNLPAKIAESLPEASSKNPRVISLKEAFHEASKNNVKVLLAQEKKKEVRGRVWQSYSGWLPHVSGEVSQVRETVNLASLGFTPDAFPGLQNTFLGPFNSFDARISLVQNIFSYTALGDLRASKSEERKLRLEEILAEEQSALDSGIAYLRLLEAEANLKGARSDVELASHIARLLKDQFQAGLANIVDQTRAETQLSLSQSLSRPRRITRSGPSTEAHDGVALATPIRLSNSLVSIREPASRRP
jgi:outer membrane protein TolC